MRGTFQLLGGCLLTLVLGSGSLQAQGLIWSLPEPGTWARYAGEYRQVTLRPTSSEGDLSLQWQSLLEIRCLERTTAEWKGTEVPCLWLELESQVGQQVDGQLETGPGSVRIYKILVPEQEVIGLGMFDLPFPRAYLPIVKGYRQVGMGDPEPLVTPVFQSFPVLSHILINETAQLGDTGSTQVSLENQSVQFETRQIECTTALENPSSRSTNNTTLWVSEDAPFGLVRWVVRTERETKTLVDPRDEFTKHADFSVEMSLVQTGDNATSKLENLE